MKGFEFYSLDTTTSQLCCCLRFSVASVALLQSIGVPDAAKIRIQCCFFHTCCWAETLCAEWSGRRRNLLTYITPVEGEGGDDARLLMMAQQ